MSKILVLGGTGAMGTYLVPELIEMGHQVDVIALDGVNSNHPNFSYVNANAKDDVWLREQLKNSYDAIVDFMIYSTTEFKNRLDLLLQNTNHYIFFSSYRVYANDTPITEESPRLLDVSRDTAFLATAETEYSLYKAQQEDLLRNANYGNYTIVRPAITYSKRRSQLVTLEANVVVYRAMNQLPVLLPQSALSVQATMSWAGDVAKMLSLLVLNPAVFKEVYTLATAEHRTWQEIAEYYKELIGLTYLPVDDETYLSFFNSTNGAKYQLLYDRCFDRIVDNSKILTITGIKQEDLMPLKAGLQKELSALSTDVTWGKNMVNDHMDIYLKEKGLLK